MRLVILPALLLSAVVASSASAAPADFGLTEGYPYDKLSVDVAKTREYEGGTTMKPQMWLTQVPIPSADWTEVSVIATPQTGVCAVGGNTALIPISEAEVPTKAVELLSKQFLSLTDEFGGFQVMVGEQLVADYTLENALDVLATDGSVHFVSQVATRPDIEGAHFYVAYDGEFAGAAYTIFYQNGEACSEIINQ